MTSNNIVSLDGPEAITKLFDHMNICASCKNEFDNNRIAIMTKILTHAQQDKE